MHIGRIIFGARLVKIYAKRIIECEERYVLKNRLRKGFD